MQRDTSAEKGPKLNKWLGQRSLLSMPVRVRSENNVERDYL